MGPTVKDGLINDLNYLVRKYRKYQAVAEQNLALAKSHRVGVVDNSINRRRIGLIELNTRRKEAP